jgi:hypothetical protein
LYNNKYSIYLYTYLSNIPTERPETPAATDLGEEARNETSVVHSPSRAAAIRPQDACSFQMSREKSAEIQRYTEQGVEPEDLIEMSVRSTVMDLDETHIII